MNKIYKGVIHSLLPQKGFGFITPTWSNGDSEENIFFHLSETKGGKCYLPALASPENREEVVGKKGTKTYVPKEEQIVYFELDAQEVHGRTRLIAKRLKDVKSISEEDAKQADLNTEKPSVEELLHPTEETIDLAVTADTIKTTEVEPKDDACTVEASENSDAVVDNQEIIEDEYEEYDDYDEEDYDEYAEYDNDEFYVETTKGRKDNRKSSRNKFDD